MKTVKKPVRKEKLYGYTYVAAIVTNVHVGSPEAIKFKHTYVEARDENHAYELGQTWLSSNHTFMPSLQTINDLVIRITD